MNLIIDIGNTRTKHSIFANNTEIDCIAMEETSEEAVDEILIKYPGIRKCILSATGHTPQKYIQTLQKNIEIVFEFDHLALLPFKSAYQTLHTIGLDRLAGISGATALFPGSNVLIVDAGTAITYDLLSEKGLHHGGNISPGIDMRLRALHEFTHKLPLVPKGDNVSMSLGKSTSDAIKNGVVNGVVYELNGYIDQLQGNYKKLTVIVTGGNAQFFADKLKKAIFVVQNLVSTGLNTILNYNVKNN